jgi:hypothetical protein
MNEATAIAMRDQVQAYATDHGLIFHGPSEEGTEWPEMQGRAVLLLTAFTLNGEPMFGMHRCENPTKSGGPGMDVMGGSLDGTPLPPEVYDMAARWPGAVN